MAIWEQRYITIRNKIITRADVQKLAKVIASIAKRKKKGEFGYGFSLRYAVKCDDGSAFSSREIDIFDDDSPINSKKVEEITMYYHSPDSGQLIDVKISHSLFDNKYTNSITVEGNDSNWVIGTLKRLEEIIDSFAPQNMAFKKYEKQIGITIAAVISLFGFRLGERALSIISPNFVPFSFENPSIRAFLISLTMNGLITMIWYIPFFNIWWKIHNLFPSVELQLAPDHKLAEKRKRILLMNIAVIILIPIILQVAFELLKSFS